MSRLTCSNGDGKGAWVGFVLRGIGEDVGHFRRSNGEELPGKVGTAHQGSGAGDVTCGGLGVVDLKRGNSKLDDFIDVRNTHHAGRGGINYKEIECDFASL